ncbi:amidohydrolase [soil metagenome]
MKLFFMFVVVVLSCTACTNKYDVDTVYVNGNVYTVDSSFQIVQAFAVKDGKIYAAGTSESILKLKYKNKIDLQGKFVYPGFIDAHCHFYGYGIDLAKTWLIGTSSFEDIVDTLATYKDRRFMGWVFGRGWDQNDWTIKEFPDKSKLDSLFPEVPVFLMRIDGHAALVNQKALDLAGITEATKISGGEILKNNGKLTGLLIDNAVDLVKLKIPVPADKDRATAMMSAQKNCFEKGLTTVYDAGLDHEVIEFLDSLQKAGELKMRMYIMASYDSSNAAYYRIHGKYKTEMMNVRSFKLYADGALGSRGACMLEPYSDLHAHFGFLLSDIDSIRMAASIAAEIGFQLNTHCIGDSANRLLLNIYSSVLKGKNDLRWRIEHAQVLNPSDFYIFRDYSIIPSVQPTHATSDMYWAGDRVGPIRLKTAYAYKQLLEQNGMIADGSDFPVEDINPLFGFYAAVSRKDQKGFPANGFQKENALTREQALKAMTIWAAYSGFEEHEKGSLEPGKFADFVILQEDLMNAPEEELFKFKVQSTFINGVQVFGK